MTDIKLKIWNYRSIPQDSPVELHFKDGITFILGVNNVGKSNLLRLMFEFREFLFFSANQPTFSNNFNSQFFYDHVVNRRFPKNGVKLEIHVGDKIIAYQINPNGPLHTSQFNISYSINPNSINTSQKAEEIRQTIEALRSSLYIGAARVVLNQTSASYYDINIGSQFYTTWSSWATGGDIEKSEKIRMLILELKELFNFNNFDITVNDSKNTLLVRTDDGQFMLEELGSGIAHFILTLANALIKNPAFIFIDEPETGLHPKLQQLFIQALASKARIGLIATSHSVALARSTADFILSLTKSSNGKVKLEPFGQHFSPSIDQSITELGYSQYVELGGTSILLVEGRTDVKSFREILRLFKIESKFIILSFGGRQFMTKNKGKIIDELNEIKRITPSVAVIFDSEKTSERAPLKEEFTCFKECCEELGFKVFPTEYHSTENYIHKDAITAVLNNPNINPLRPYEKFDGRWEKEKNWLMFRVMKKENFSITNLRTFIENVLSKMS